MKLREIYDDLEEFKRLRRKANRLADTTPADLFITAVTFDDYGVPAPEALAAEILQNERLRVSRELWELSQKHGIDTSELDDTKTLACPKTMT